MKVFRFLSYPRSDRLLMLRMTWYILRAEVVFRVLPYSAARALVFKQISLRRSPPSEPIEVLRRHFKILAKLRRNLPWSVTCLRQAVALRDSLAREGVASTIKIGLCRDKGEFLAHAWLECCGHEILKNGPYSELTSINGGMNNDK